MLMFESCEPMFVLRKNEPRKFTGKDGQEHEAYSLLLSDGIYPVRYQCNHELYDSVQADIPYRFRVAVSNFQGKVSVKLVGLV